MSDLSRKVKNGVCYFKVHSSLKKLLVNEILVKRVIPIQASLPKWYEYGSQKVVPDKKFVLLGNIPILLPRKLHRRLQFLYLVVKFKFI